MVYFDNAATSFPKPRKVYDKMDYFIRNFCANAGRGSHKLAVKTSEEIFICRKLLAEFFNVKDPNRIIFTKNATEAINIAIFGLLKEKDHVIISSMEHNSIVRPLKKLEGKGIIELSIVKCNENGMIMPGDIQKEVKSNTKLIAVTHASNVTGLIMPIEEIGKIAKNKNIKFLIDIAQTAGAEEINVELINVDLLAFTGHKSLFGPQGIGGLYIAPNVELDSFMLGGTGTNSEILMQPDILPDKFESGTQNAVGIVGLRYGIEFINEVSIKEIKLKKQKLVEAFAERISQLSKIIIYSDIKNIKQNSGIISLNFMGIDSVEVGYVLDNFYGIAVRTGLHCSPLAHETLGTKNSGTIRFSFSYFNTIIDLDTAYKSLKEIEDNILESH